MNVQNNEIFKTSLLALTFLESVRDGREHTLRCSASGLVNGDLIPTEFTVTFKPPLEIYTITRQDDGDWLLRQQPEDKKEPVVERRRSYTHV